MQHSFDQEDPEILWVNADAPDAGCSGAYDNPYSTLETALDRVQPGQTIVLMRGDYIGDCNIQKSGTINRPIKIFAEEPGSVTISRASWFFYDTSDLIVSGFTFLNAPAGALSLIGACSRNRFDQLRFTDCGNRGETACTFYMGGAGGGCNIVEECIFENSTAPHIAGKKATVALMVAHGDLENSNLILNNIIRKNTFSRYDYGIIAGSDGAQTARCSNVIEYNTLNSCSKEGILVKTGDTTVRGNRLTSCPCHAITIQSDLDCTIEDNRIERAGTGIQVFGNGHTVSNNCLIGCTGMGIILRGITDADTKPALNCFVEHNTFVNCSGLAEGSASVAGIVIDTGTTGIFQNNLIAGPGRPYAIHDIADTSGTPLRLPTHFIVKDNSVMGEGEPLEGTKTTDALFKNAAAGNYETDLAAGAAGCVVTPEGFDPQNDTLAFDGANYHQQIRIDFDDEIDDCDDSDMAETEPADNEQIPGEATPGNPFGTFYDERLGDDDITTEEDEQRYWNPDTED